MAEAGSENAKWRAFQLCLKSPSIPQRPVYMFSEASCFFVLQLFSRLIKKKKHGLESNKINELH